MKYTTVIGLEIHAEMLTKSKVFCSCDASFGGEENTRVCPRCSGMPGTLPVFNRGAAELAVKAGLALGCQINRYSAFDRKNYFYPDLPKAYQITQFAHPICVNGGVDIGGKTIRINRIHIEEDAGKLVHDESENVSLADYNRCGIPLIEIVTEPDIRSAEEARAFVEQVALRLKYAEVSDSKMEQGSLRCDVNISIMPEGATEFGTRTEIKNLNSLRAIVRAIEYEYSRQEDLLECGEPVIQQTLHFNDATGTTRALRSKEEAHDYRYFPEPDIPPVILSEEDITRIANSMPEMPAQRIERYQNAGLSQVDAENIAGDKALSDFYDTAVSAYSNAKSVAAMILVELQRRMNDAGLSAEQLTMNPAELGALCKMADEGTVSRAAAKDILQLMMQDSRPAIEIAKEQGLLMSNDTSAVEAAADEVIAANEKAVNEYRSGSEKVFGFLMGQMCRKLGKSANPAVIKTVLTQKLKG